MPDINSLKPNSNKSKEQEREKLTPVVNKSGVVSTKKTFGDKVAEVFIEEDLNEVKSYVLQDVIIPGIKNTILDVMEMLFFGGSRGRARGGNSNNREKVSYASYYKSESSSRSQRQNRDQQRSRVISNEKVDYRHIVLRNRNEAEEVVDKIIRRISEYGSASVADLFDLLDITGSYNDNNWGWTNERDIGIRRVSAGYLIDVAEAQPLD